MKLIKTILAASAIAMAAPTIWAAPAMAEDFPLIAGSYTEMSGIFVQDGGSLAYAQFLAGQWKKEQEFAKSKGWISGYHIYQNVNARDGEPNLYLATTFPRIVDAVEGERRNKEYEAWDRSTNAERDAASSNRAKFRTLKGSMMLVELKVR